MGGCIPSWKEAEGGLESPDRNREHTVPLGKEERPGTPLHWSGWKGILGRRWELCIGQVPVELVFACVTGGLRLPPPSSMPKGKGGQPLVKLRVRVRGGRSE